MILIYDGSFQGFLSAVFMVYRDHPASVHIESSAAHLPELFEDTVHSPSREDLARRVLTGIRDHISCGMPRLLLNAFLTEVPGREDTLLACIQKGMRRGIGFIHDLTDPDALRMEQLSRRFTNEHHRFLGLVRFRRLAGGMYYAPIEPENNILPLLGSHFSRRFGDQDWMIHDLSRGTALIFNRGHLEMAEISLNSGTPGTSPVETGDEYFKIWQTYYKSISIAERKNTRLRMNFMPRKYWNHLPEMELEAGDLTE